MYLTTYLIIYYNTARKRREDVRQIDKQGRGDEKEETWQRKKQEGKRYDKWQI